MPLRFPPVRVLFAAMIATPILAVEPALPEPAKLPSQTELPDPLVAFDGRRVTTAKAWESERAPELRRLFQNYEYGFLPAPTKVTAKVEREDKTALGGKATLREITLTLARPEGAEIHLLLVVPNTARGPVPVFLGLNFSGNHALLADPKIAVPTKWKSGKGLTVDQVRGSEVEKWALDQVIERGYAVATFWNGEAVPDDKEAAEEMLKKLREPGVAAGSETGTIAAWAWCLQRAIDYLVTDPQLDPQRLALVGHSRNGKTALLAAALDPRVALVVPSQAGCGGTAPSRVSAELAAEGPNGRATVETVKRINTSFPHWFCGNFKAFNEEPARLPFDQHELIALCAPRPVLLSCATEDLWANPAGQFVMLRGANPVYQLVAGEGLGATAMPAVGELLSSRLGYYIRPGKHEMNRGDWKVWLDYADKWMPGK